MGIYCVYFAHACVFLEHEACSLNIISFGDARLAGDISLR
jgi:hypothetical protein